MNPYIEKLKTHLEHWPRDKEDAGGVLKLLSYYYTVANSVDDAVIRDHFRELNDILRKLSVQENDTVFNLFTKLWDSQTEQAFLTGLRTGVQLTLELQQWEM